MVLPTDAKTADFGREGAGCGPGEGDAECRLKGLTRFGEPFTCKETMARRIQRSTSAVEEVFAVVSLTRD